MNFRKISERGEGVISDPKKFVAFFFALKTPILVMIFRKFIGFCIYRLPLFLAFEVIKHLEPNKRATLEATLV